MAYLMNFLNCSSSGEQEKKALSSPEFAEWKELRKHCDTMLERGVFSGNSSNLSNPERLVLKKERRLFNAIWQQYQIIPYEMQESALGEIEWHQIQHPRRNAAEQLYWFAISPTVKLAEIRDAAEKLSYMVLPIRYVDEKTIHSIAERPDSWRGGPWAPVKNEIEQIKAQISRIAEYTKQDLYILCPASFYDLCQAEKDKEQREVIFGGELIQAKATLDTITRIQRNLFAMLEGHEADTDIWEIGEGCGYSESELVHLKMLVEIIMPIQRSLFTIAQKSQDMSPKWAQEVYEKHYEEVSKILCETTQQLSWSEEAQKALSKMYENVKPWKITETATITDVLIFALPHGTSLLYGDEFARVLANFSMNLPKSFYIGRGFSQSNSKNSSESYVFRTHLV